MTIRSLPWSRLESFGFNLEHPGRGRDPLPGELADLDSSPSFLRSTHKVDAVFFDFGQSNRLGAESAHLPMPLQAREAI